MGLLSERLVATSRWLLSQPDTRGLAQGYFGASTGAAASLVAAAELPEVVRAIVSRGGRPDLASQALGRVRAPTLLIVGGSDGPVITLNRAAMAQMSCATELAIVPGATHLFEEAGALDEVARLARGWFLRHLGTSEDSTPSRTGSFRDRIDAGRRLAEKLLGRTDLDDPVVLALPRGGVPVAGEVASALDAELDIVVVRKLGLPGQPELAIGAIASGGVRFLNSPVVRELGLSADLIESVSRQETRELERREREYRGDLLPVDLSDRTVVLVDDGIATGSTVRAAIQAVRTHGPRKVIVATPVAPPGTCEDLAEVADEVLCLLAPPTFVAISQWYDDFGQVTDDEVREVLRRHARV